MPAAGSPKLPTGFAVPYIGRNARESYMNRLMTALGGFGIVAAGALIVDPPVNLQASSPGTPQTGHANISGKLLAGNVTATSTGAGGQAVVGTASAGSGFGYGGLFKCASPSGTGVRGYATAATGFGYGGDFQTDGPTGTAVRAIAAASSGNNVGLYAKSNSPTGFAGVFEGRLKATGVVEFLGAVNGASFTGNGAGLTNVIPSGTAGGNLVGTYPNPSIANDAINSARLAADLQSISKITQNTVMVDANHHVGIGTGANNLAKALTIENGIVSCTEGAGVNRAFFGTDAGDKGFLTLADTSSVAQVQLNINPQNQGQVIADVKNFRTENPDDIGTDIYYASVEGPEAAAYVRGTARLVNGRAFVPFPSHFRAVAVAEGMTVQLTPHSVDTYGLAILSKSAEGISVGELQRGTGNFEFDWEVKCVRKGYENYQVIRPWDAGYLPEDKARAWKARQELYRHATHPEPKRR